MKKDLWEYPIVNKLLCFIQNYNHKKYWKRRSYVVSRKGNLFLKLYYLIWIKRIDAYHNASFGATLNSGCQFISPPRLPHGPNGIIVGHDAKVGKNCCICQQVTICHGGVVIGDNVLIGAGAKILSGVHIGNNVNIGANCVVVEDIPDNATVVLPKPRIIIRKQ